LHPRVGFTWSGRGGGRNGYVIERRNPKLVVNSDFDPIVAELRTAAQAISGFSKFNLASMS
jgi:hypothetical protein